MTRYTRMQLAGRGSTYILGTVAPILVALLITPLVVRVLGPNEYGYVAMAITTYQAVAVILPLGLPAAVTRHALIESTGRKGAVGLVIAGSAIAGAVALPIALSSPLWSAVLFQYAGWLFVLPVASAVGLAWMALAQSMLRADDRATSFVGLGWLIAVLPPACALALCLTTEPRADLYLAVLAGSHLLVGAGAVLFSCMGTQPSTSRRECFEALRIALPTVPHQLAMASLGVVVVALGVSLGGVTVGGRLQLAMLLGTAPLVVLGAVNNAWAPMIYRTPASARRETLRRSTAAVALLCLGLATGFVLTAPALARFLAGADSASFVLENALVISMALGFMVLYLANIHLVFVSGRTRGMAVTTPLALILATLVAAGSALATGDVTWAVTLIPLFYAFQSIASAGLRRLARQEAPTFWVALPATAGAIAVPLIAFVGMAAGEPSIAMVGAVSVAVLATLLAGLLRNVGRPPGTSDG
ncbi:lipopolysaccharide biosynthesis protein [Microbacterium sp. SS28]|uniref:lipopolysaccharide biosynthesis protein n=1 Tax=Microbacterium sp. SS28 TaxID=2919948 RepID=UPI001FA9B47F|nr:oligosaccharide flippase family protein [Microbacterium sp. SS28]